MFALVPAVGMSGNYQIKKSLRFNSVDGAYISRTFGSTGNRKTWTWSAWVKRSSLSTAQVLLHTGTTNGNYFTIYIADDNSLVLGVWAGPFVSTNAVFRDVSAWYHVVVAMDTTQSTVNDRVKIYINGVQNTSWKTNTISSYYSQNTDTPVNQIQQHTVSSRLPYAADSYLNSYLAEFNFIDGQALTADSFGKIDSTTGQWIPKKYSGTYGTNGFYLPFDDGTSTTTLGYDRSGNANNWTLTNFTRSAGVNDDWMEDSPTNNYCTLNPLAYSGSNTSSNGGLYASMVVSSGAYGVRGTMPIISGMKSYFEVHITSVNTWAVLGILNVAYALGGTNYAHSAGSDCVLYYRVSGQKVVNGTISAYNGTTYANGDIIGVAVDYVNNECTFYKNGVSQGAISLPSASVAYVPIVGDLSNQNCAYDLNFGQRAFAYTPPTGFKSLCTKNLPTPTIKKASKYFDVKLHTGGASPTTVAGLNFSPDFVWIKARNSAQNNVVFDVTRGVQQLLSTNLTSAESTDNTTLTSFNADGFTVSTANTTGSNGINYVDWCWKESPTAGFDVVTYTGTAGAQTLNHSLGAVPTMIITKSRSGVGNWSVYHKDANASPETGCMWLNVTNSWTSSSLLWNNTAPTTTQFTVGANNTDSNYNGQTMIAYLFAEVPGYSKIGKYTGNGSADGPFVHCGFKPAYVMVKSTGVSDWYVWDTARNTYNLIADMLRPNLANSELNSATYVFDFVSNGFKVRGTGVEVNSSGSTYIFVAFADAPYKYSTAR